jgi:hypothetical protein
MKNNNSFGVHFVLRTQKAYADDKIPVYARITVNRTRCEVTIKYSVFKNDSKSFSQLTHEVLDFLTK